MADKMVFENITIPDMIDISEIPMGNFTVNTLRTECVYPQYGIIFIFNFLLLLIPQFRINRYIESRLNLNDYDNVHRAVKYILSDGFCYDNMFALNMFFFLYTFLYMPVLLPLLS